MKAVKSLALILLLASAALNGIHAARLWLASDHLNAALSARTLEPGETMPMLVAPSIAGEPVAVVPMRLPRRLLLYWMSPECVWCKQNEVSFRVLANGARPAVDVVAIASGSTTTRDFVAKTRPPYLVLGPPAPAVIEAYQFTMTPMTVVLNENRTVERVWRGVYKGAVKTEIEKFFGLALPEIQF